MRRGPRSDLHRCPTCRMHRTLCLCALVPTIPTRTRVILIQHQLELRKTTNTGQLALRCLPNSAAVLRGAGATTDPAAAWRDSPCALVLFPHRDAEPLERWRDAPHPLTLIVPDGTWRQAARARRRVAGLDHLPCAFLPQEAPSAYRLRSSGRPGHLSTLEAVARALGVLEDPSIRTRLEQILRVMVERTLWTNGRLSTDEVTSGIPSGIKAHDPVGSPRAPPRPPSSDPSP